MSGGQKKAYEDDMELLQKEKLNRLYAKLDASPDSFLYLLEVIKANVTILMAPDIQLTRYHFGRLDNIHSSIKELLT